MHTEFWLVNLKVRDHSEDLGISKGEDIPVLNQAPGHEYVLGAGGIVPCILVISNRRR
jgi:hypothetical protein